MTAIALTKAVDSLLSVVQPALERERHSLRDRVDNLFHLSTPFQTRETVPRRIDEPSSGMHWTHMPHEGSHKIVTVSYVRSFIADVRLTHGAPQGSHCYTLLHLPAPCCTAQCPAAHPAGPCCCSATPARTVAPAPLWHASNTRSRGVGGKSKAPPKFVNPLSTAAAKIESCANYRNIIPSSLPGTTPSRPERRPVPSRLMGKPRDAERGKEGPPDDRLGECG
jgi:hypothetical protein